MTRRGYTTGVCCLIAVTLLGGSWKENGKAVPDTTWAKSDGDFGAELVFTDKPDELFAAWEKPGLAVYFSDTPTAVRGVPIVAVVFFTGCATDTKGNCNATVRFTAQSPNGKPYGNPLDAELWVEKPPPGKGQIQLSVGNMGIVIEPGDALGAYRVKAEITDKVAKKKMVLERSFTVAEAAKNG
jgi:hypothetical protein